MNDVEKVHKNTMQALEKIVKESFKAPPIYDRCVRECAYMDIKVYGHGMGEGFCRLDGRSATGTCRHMRLWSEWKK